MSLEYLDQWLSETPSAEHESDDNPVPEETEWEKTKEWWEPFVFEDAGEKKVEWLCDHLGDAQDVMEHLWNEVLRLRDIIDNSGGE